jgi:NOL1/NOP2/sun family putative RNA methylase
LQKDLPTALIQSLQNLPGYNEETFLHVHASGEQVTSIRYNPFKFPFKSAISNQQPATQEVPWCPYGKYLNERPSFTLDPLFHAGAYYVQEASSMFLWHVLQQTIDAEIKGLKILDLCAAPGGKTTLLASYFTKGLIVANEIIKSRTSVLVENCTKWGSDNVVVTNNDSKDFKYLEGYFDVMVVDAPCSGSGLFRKDVDAIEEWSKENVMLCSQRQKRILADVYGALKKDGLLIYSTCSYSIEENEMILDWLMENYQLSTIICQLEEDWNIVEVQSEKHKAYGYRFYPDKMKGEGFFIAAFRKNEHHHFSEKKPAIAPASKRDSAAMKTWLNNEKPLSFFKQSDIIIALPEMLQQEVALLQKYLYLRKAGIAIGELKGKDIIPHHELALSLLLNETISTVALNKEEALQYLKKKEIHLNISTKG